MKKSYNSIKFLFAFSVCLFLFATMTVGQDTIIVQKDSVSSGVAPVEPTAVADASSNLNSDSVAAGTAPTAPPVATDNSSSQVNSAIAADSSINITIKNTGSGITPPHSKNFVPDNTYYIVYPDKLILRLYLSNNFAPLTISSSGKEDLNYKTNSKVGLGAGFTYKAVTINLSYGFNFLNPSNGRGNTKGLDLQIHLYPKKWAIDVIGAFLKGYYLDPKDLNGLGLSNYYQRPDINRSIVGLAIYRVANSNKFSYRAAFNQKDWQTKSAGSLLYGAEAYYGIVKADSTLVPSWANSDYGQAGINKINFFNIGPGIGYAYTLVLSNHFFLTGSLIVSAHLNISQEENNDATQTKIKLLPGGNYKAGFGYNSSSWSVTAALLGNALYTGSSVSRKEYFLPTGNMNLVVARKFGGKRKE